MTVGRAALRLIFLVLCFLAVMPASVAQTESATLSGLITDPQGKVVPGAAIEVTSVDTNVSTHQTTNSAGVYVVVGLKPGRYRVSISKEGFRRIDLADLVLNVQDVLSRNFQLQLGPVLASITVVADEARVNTESAAVGTVVDRQFVENTPLNGRNLQSLIALTPGITLVPGGQSGVAGDFSVNGQRTETNYYTVDGVSANTGMSAGGTLSQGSGTTPALTTLGTTQSMVSVDALQEFRISSSTYSAEYGRTPGAQISFVTRSGTNEWHGSAFDYLRNDVFDASNWFNGYANNPPIPKQKERQNDFGGTLAGPIHIPGLYNGKDKTFFFFSYEGLRLRTPQPAANAFVPDSSLRQSAPSPLQPLLNSFPVQNGPEQGNNLALFSGSYSSPSGLDSYSIRIDHALGKRSNLFGRYSNSPSHVLTRDLTANPAITTDVIGHVDSWTVGFNSVLSSRLANELRFNHTNNRNSRVDSSDNFGGAIPITTTQLFPGTTVPPGWVFGAAFLFGGAPIMSLFQGASPQHQWNIVESMTSSVGSHTLTYGVDYRRLTSSSSAGQLSDELLYFSPSDVLSNAASLGLVNTLPEVPTGVYTNFSAFVQDEWRTNTRLHLSLGLRWELNPPPRAANGPQPYTLNQISNLATTQLASAGTPAYKTDYLGFAPRVGVAYILRQGPGHTSVIRGGFGVFYDLGTALGLNGLANSVGFGSSALYSAAAFPLTAAQNTLPPPSVASPYNNTVVAVDPHLRLPYTLQWNGAIEQGLGANQTLTMSYVAAAGRRLMNQEFYSLVGINPNFSQGFGLFLGRNGSYSNYNSLQVQFQRRLSRGLQLLASYTWSHAIDNLSSTQSSFIAPIRGNADFDVRHTFTAAATYDVPGSYAHQALNTLLKRWSIDLRQSANSALPLDVFSGFAVLGNGQQAEVPADLVQGIPAYVYGSQYPGGKALNGTPGAVVGGCPDGSVSVGPFCPPPSGQAGNIPRNGLRGFGAWQTDLAIRKEFPLHDRLKLHFRAEAFNLFNHPNFGSIINLTSAGPLFGRASATLNTLSSANALYGAGGPRSLQLALKLEF